LGNERAADVARITEASKKMYLMRLERVLRDAGIAFGADQSKQITQPRVMPWKTFLECSRLIAAVSGVATEPKVDVNIGADAKLRDVRRAFAEGAKSARCRRGGVVHAQLRPAPPSLDGESRPCRSLPECI